MKVIVELPTGATMEVECTPQLLKQIRERSSLDPNAEVTPDHVRRFLAIELISALSKEVPSA